MKYMPYNNLKKYGNKCTDSNYPETEQNMDKEKRNVMLTFLMSQIKIIFYYLAQCQKKEIKNYFM
jgi:hypothetical protein